MTEKNKELIQRMRSIAQASMGPDAVRVPPGIQALIDGADALEAALAQQPQGEAVANNEAYDLAYDKIDRFLRSNLDDDDYAEFSRALDSLFAAPAPTQDTQVEPLPACRPGRWRDGDACEPAVPAPSDGAQLAEKTVAAIDSALRGKVNDPDPLPKLHAHSVAGEPTTYGLVAGLLRERDALIAKVAKFDQRIVDIGVLAMETAAPSASAQPAATICEACNGSGEGYAGSVCGHCLGRGEFLADAMPDYKVRFETMVSMIGEISDALGIPDDEAACANGNDLILSAISQLRAPSAISHQEKLARFYPDFAAGIMRESTRGAWVRYVAAPSASAQQAEPVANNEAYDLAYDKIDRFLRSNLDDDDYAEFSRALDSLFAAPAPTQDTQVEPLPACRPGRWRDGDACEPAVPAPSASVQYAKREDAPYAPLPVPSASPSADQAADRQWRAGFLAGWNAGIEGDKAKLRAAQNRVGKLADYEPSASPAALTVAVKALEQLASVPGCGCDFPCRCGGAEWTRAELEGRMDIASEALGKIETMEGRALLAASPAKENDNG